MLNRLRCFWMMVILVSSLYGGQREGHRLAAPGYRFNLPHDLFEHPDYQTEWWYYTGNLQGKNGQKYGFEVTFFRFRPDKSVEEANQTETWRASQIYIAHFAVTDLSAKRFYHQERINRAGPGIAGVDEQRRSVWNGNWSVHWLSFAPDRQVLEAVTEKAHLKLTLIARKKPVFHGKNGLSQKGPEPGEASLYFSYTRLGAEGYLSLGGATQAVTGQAWMDREIFSSTDPGKDPQIRGWDWMCVQLDNNEELMLYRLRLNDGRISPYSSGTIVDSAGRTKTLTSSQIILKPGATWHSGTTGGDYPVAWTVTVPSLQLELTVTTEVLEQELVDRITRNYWEGSVVYRGTKGVNPVRGIGYLEMTGYARSERKPYARTPQR